MASAPRQAYMYARRSFLKTGARIPLERQANWKRFVSPFSSCRWIPSMGSREIG